MIVRNPLGERLMVKRVPSVVLETTCWLREADMILPGGIRLSLLALTKS